LFIISIIINTLNMFSSKVKQMKKVRFNENTIDTIVKQPCPNGTNCKTQYCSFEHPWDTKYRGDLKKDNSGEVKSTKSQCPNGTNCKFQYCNFEHPWDTKYRA
jgi:hypothetical protein